MTLPYLNDRVNQLRLSRRTAVLHWPRVKLPARAVTRMSLWLLAICIGIVISCVVADAFRNLLLAPLVAILGDLLLWAHRAKYEVVRVPTRSFLYAPITAIWFFA